MTVSSIASHVVSESIDIPLPWDELRVGPTRVYSQIVQTVKSLDAMVGAYPVDTRIQFKWTAAMSNIGDIFG